ncbi:MAG: Glycosyl transferase family 2 [Candidatus Woesebacteria bacterium GW2011_GWC1_42_9]|nr:MAG: Glycosyl transferase family 2 [Candidatus Woesebacteria bacterium GW2011_GWC1_42_9]
MGKTAKLSIIIVSYNTKKLLNDCLHSLEKVAREADFEVVVCDNRSVDGSVDMIKKSFPWVKLIVNDNNLGFAKGNNVARGIALGKYILFLNPDTLVFPGAIGKTISYLDTHKEVGAITCKVVLPNGKLDKDTRRSFPTPWVALTHFSGLDRVFPKSKIFSKYWYGYLSASFEHEVEVLQGAFFMTRKKILDKVGWFDEDYFLNGEDIDLCWRIKLLKYKIIYFPEVKIIHLKKGSKKKAKSLKIELAGVEAMEIFYRKRLWKRYSLLTSYSVIFGIKIIKLVRLVKYYFL